MNQKKYCKKTEVFSPKPFALMLSANLAFPRSLDEYALSDLHQTTKWIVDIGATAHMSKRKGIHGKLAIALPSTGLSDLCSRALPAADRWMDPSPRNMILLEVERSYPAVFPTPGWISIGIYDRSAP